MQIKIPEVSIRWAVGKRHVGDTIASVREEIREKAQKAKLSPAVVEACEEYAEKVHLENRRTYLAVTLGMLDGSKATRAALDRLARSEP